VKGGCLEALDKDTKADEAAESLPLGAHLVTPRMGYMHHGIYVGGGQVIHYAGLATGFKSAPIEEVTLEAFGNGQEVTALVYSERAFWRPRDCGPRTRATGRGRLLRLFR
jgi:hypothetical protein